MKVFGIGLSRTGTKSLTKALSILGYRSAHFDIGVKALRQTDNGLAFDYSLLTDWDSLTDIPAAAFYEALDKHFPQSKFILTIREKDAWLESCERHYYANHVPYFEKHNIEADIVLRLNCLVYGREIFDLEAFNMAYDSHVKQVRSYFQNRQSDLLIVNICAGEGWKPLCQFLDKQVPATPFPHIITWEPKH